MRRASSSANRSGCCPDPPTLSPTTIAYAWVWGARSLARRRERSRGLRGSRGRPPCRTKRAPAGSEDRMPGWLCIGLSPLNSRPPRRGNPSPRISGGSLSFLSEREARACGNALLAEGDALREDVHPADPGGATAPRRPASDGRRSRRWPCPGSASTRGRRTPSDDVRRERVPERRSRPPLPGADRTRYIRRPAGRSTRRTTAEPSGGEGDRAVGIEEAPRSAEGAHEPRRERVAAGGCRDAPAEEADRRRLRASSRRRGGSPAGRWSCCGPRRREGRCRSEARST